MDDSELDAETADTKWFVDTDWLEGRGRSFQVLAKGVLCPKCNQKLLGKGKTVTNDRMIKTVKDCCSKSPDFIQTRMPVMESVFRLLLANGNKPMALAEIVKQLGDRWGVGIYRIPDATLNALLQTDKYYGLRQPD
jgi:DNA-directed RNA polymerase subunit RPC12/RpoP